MGKHKKFKSGTGLAIKWFAAFVSLVCVFVSTARAQKPAGWSPESEVSGTFSFVRANAANGRAGFNLNGGSGSWAYAYSNRFSAIADVGAYHFIDSRPGLNSTIYTYLFGPRITFSGTCRVVPYAQILLGGGRLNANSHGIKAGENGLAVTIGGGLDIPYHRFVLRIVQAEYFMTRFNSASGLPARQNNIRISAGVVFRFSKK